MANPFVHMELTTPDLAKSKEFYSKLFGWKITDNDMGDSMTYSTFKPDDGPGGGMFTMPGVPNMWLPYVGVKDINEATRQATGLGAKIIRGPQEVPNMGWFTIISDPNGTGIALWQSTNM
jgi:uncharacterized protein